MRSTTAISRWGRPLRRSRFGGRHAASCPQHKLHAVPQLPPTPQPRRPRPPRPAAPQVIFDTGSSNLWVAAYNCSLSCGLHARYDPAKSSTYRANGTKFAIRYASGPVSGWVEQDLVNVGGLATNVSFAMVDDAGGLGPAFLIGQFDGIMGLAFASISVDAMTPVFQAFVQNNMLDENVFGFYLESSGQSGELEIGGIDRAHYSGDLQWIDLSSDTYWETKLDRVSVGGVPAAVGVVKAVFDTGTSLLAMPVADVAAIAKQVGATPLIEGEYTIDCGKIPSLPDMTITVGGTDFVLTGADYVLNVDNLGVECLLGLVGLSIPPPAGPLVILGDVFQRKYYTACVDQPRLPALDRSATHALTRHQHPLPFSPATAGPTPRRPPPWAWRPSSPCRAPRRRFHPPKLKMAKQKISYQKRAPAPPYLFAAARRS